ncbi:squamosa promoter-binding 1 [Olea europaea subsp. europaea]|uniref:Squamosa promoter-binding 1 n=1 Tax=Olea europaea subsp. europaea TaxID=158383 RepID=A0A8S0QCK7_OLEEU|nr:squamosa promoter-binding 1 [Olea europaea subsp. europaea]
MHNGIAILRRLLESELEAKLLLLKMHQLRRKPSKNNNVVQNPAGFALLENLDKGKLSKVEESLSILISVYIHNAGFGEDNINAAWLGRQGIALALLSVADELRTKDLSIVMYYFCSYWERLDQANVGILSEIIQVEDHDVSSSFFPCIVAEDDVCTEICMLESKIELVVTDSLPRGTEKLEAHNQAMNFIQEMGWLLFKNSLKSRLEHWDHNSKFPFKLFKYLVKFFVDHDLCVVLNKPLDILFS